MNILKIKLNDPKMLKTITTLFELFPQLVAEVMSQTKKEEVGLQVYYYCCRKNSTILSIKVIHYIEVNILSFILMMQKFSSRYKVLILKQNKTKKTPTTRMQVFDN